MVPTGQCVRKRTLKAVSGAQPAFSVACNHLLLCQEYYLFVFRIYV